jgi:hypothetical protein
MTDVDLLLAATIAAVRMNRPPILFEPPAFLADCVQCQKAYARARKISRTREGSRSAWSGWRGLREFCEAQDAQAGP